MCWTSVILSFTNHLKTLIAIKQRTRNVWVFGNRPLQCSVICFFEFLTTFTLKGSNFFIFNTFSMIVSVSDAPRERVQVLFGHQKNNRALPLDPACPKHLTRCYYLVFAGVPRVKDRLNLLSLFKETHFHTVILKLVD